jgi:hypothetical protein
MHVQSGTQKALQLYPCGEMRPFGSSPIPTGPMVRRRPRCDLLGCKSFCTDSCFLLLQSVVVVDFHRRQVSNTHVDGAHSIPTIELILLASAVIDGLEEYHRLPSKAAIFSVLATISFFVYIRTYCEVVVIDFPRHQGANTHIDDIHSISSIELIPLAVAMDDLEEYHRLSSTTAMFSVMVTLF